MTMCAYSLYRSKITIEAIHGLMSQVLKDRIFNSVNTGGTAAALPGLTDQATLAAPGDSQ